MSRVEIETILVPTDFSATSMRALAYALQLGVALEARIYILHVWPEPTLVDGRLLVTKNLETMTFAEWRRKSGEDRLAEFLATTPDIPNRDEDTVQLRSGKPAVKILELARELGADLIVMGSRRQSKIVRTLLGSVADKVVRASDCPVLTVPPVQSKDVS